MEVIEPGRPEVARARRVVLKVGTSVLAAANGGVESDRLAAIVAAASGLRRDGRQALIVSSGAVGLGKSALGLERVPTELEERQACAAVGQSRLVGLWEKAFSRHGHLTAQVLLTEGDFDDRVRYLNLRSTLMTLLRHGVVPVINENDAVSTEELAFDETATKPVFGDNDRLSALVASKLGADLLVLLTDVDGLYDRDPRAHTEARLLTRLDARDEAVEAGGAGSALGRGGMASKLEAAQLVARAGCHAVIASGLYIEALAAVLAGEEIGTWVPARGELAAKRRWIAFAARPRGRLVLDDGAVAALERRGASLLAAGVKRVEGEFRPGDVVELAAPDGHTIGRGMVYCDAAGARDWCGGNPPAGIRNHHALVHRDHMVLED